MRTDTVTTTATYDDDLSLARVLLAERMGRPAAALDDPALAEQISKSQLDALNNTWVEGYTVTEWAARAVQALSAATAAAS